MSSPDHDKTAPRRQAGRHMLSLTKALTHVLAAFERSKGDPQTKPEAREACDHALTELRRSMESLAWLRESLRASLQPEERATIA